MKWNVCVIGGLICIAGLILYCSAVVAGRADRRMKDYIWNSWFYSDGRKG